MNRADIEARHEHAAIRHDLDDNRPDARDLAELVAERDDVMDAAEFAAWVEDRAETLVKQERREREGTWVG